MARLPPPRILPPPPLRLPLPNVAEEAGPTVSGPVPQLVAVVIPAFEAARTIADVVGRARAALPTAHILVVDDGSTDDTAGRARAAGAQVLRVDRNGGKGRALAAGLAAAVSGGASVVATLDADGQHPAGLLPDLVAPVTAGEADLVLGARHRAGAMPWQRRLSNWLSAVLATRIAGMPVVDAQTGFRAMRCELAERIRPAGRRYEWELAFLIEALRAGYRVVSVSVPTVYQGEVSHFRSVSDTWRIARVFVRYSRQILFGVR